MTSSIPQFVQVDGPPSVDTTVQPKSAGPVPDTPEADALASVMRELEKIPQEHPVGPAAAAASTPLMTRTEQADAIAQLAMEALPKMVELTGLVQQCQALMVGVEAQVQMDHKEIHALKERVSFLEEQMAGKPKEISDPAMDLPTPSVLSPVAPAPGGIEVNDSGP